MRIHTNGQERVSIHSLPDRAELGRSLSRALGNTGITVIYQNLDLRVAWAQNVPSTWPRSDIVGLADHEFLPASDCDRIVEFKQGVIQAGIAQRVEMRQSSDGGVRWYDMWLDADHDDDGQIRGIVTTLVETTAHKTREQTLRSLLREVSHRSKNLLAIIQSIATQTGRYSGSIDVFLARFRGRLQSLASSQDLVTSSNWRGAQLSELVQGQASRYCEDPAYSIRLDGVDPHLSPNAALHIGLALHELIVNSMSHGALVERNGYVSLSSRLKQDGEGRREFILIWSEKPPPSPKPDVRKRFGSVALERVVPASLDGEAEFIIQDGLVEYKLRVPDANFDLD